MQWGGARVRGSALLLLQQLDVVHLRLHPLDVVTAQQGRKQHDERRRRAARRELAGGNDSTRSTSAHERAQAARARAHSIMSW
eukprot:4077420-Prymnesium_polylepis.1